MTARAPLRLHCDLPLAADAEIALGPETAHYVLHVMRRTEGDALLLFNARDGEWRAILRSAGKRTAVAFVSERTRPPAVERGPVLVFAPVKRGATELVIEKATELGAAAIRPVLTMRTQSDRLRRDRLMAIAREAAEQCGRLSLPEIAEPAPLGALLASWDRALSLYFCDERGSAPGLLERALANRHPQSAVLIGPEGGFAPREAELISGLGFVHPVSLGPRILRAETAAIAALTILRAVGEQMPPVLQ